MAVPQIITDLQKVKEDKWEHKHTCGETPIRGGKKEGRGCLVNWQIRLTYPIRIAIARFSEEQVVSAYAAAVVAQLQEKQGDLD